MGRAIEGQLLISEKILTGTGWCWCRNVSECGVSGQNEIAWPPATGEAMGFDLCASMLSASLEWNIALSDTRTRSLGEQ